MTNMFFAYYPPPPFRYKIKQQLKNTSSLWETNFYRLAGTAGFSD